MSINDEEAFVEEQIQYILHRITQVRNEKGFSILKLSELSGVSTSYLFQLEHGKTKGITMVYLLKICYALQINVSDLLPEPKCEHYRITSGDVFDEITNGMSEKERNILLEMVRNCKGLIEYREKGNYNERAKSPFL